MYSSADGPELDTSDRPGHIAEVVDRYRAGLHQIAGVAGVAMGRTAAGDDAIVVYLTHDVPDGVIPAELDGYPVQLITTGSIDTL